jgi:hypothetical protein
MSRKGAKYFMFFFSLEEGKRDDFPFDTLPPSQRSSYFLPALQAKIAVTLTVDAAVNTHDLDREAEL